MKTFILAGAIALASSAASAATLTLDFTGISGGTNVNLGGDFIANDLRIQDGNCHLPLSGAPCGAVNRGEVTVITREGGGLFDVSSYWYQLLGANADLEITARDADAMIIGQELFTGPVDGANDGGDTVLVGYTGVFSLTFDNLSSNPGNARFDDISVTFDDGDDPSPVPLPAAGLMLLTALGGAAALRRKS